MLEKKSKTELRAIAQSLGVPDIFEKTDQALRQEIFLKQKELVPPPAAPIPRPEYDARLMARPPAKICTQESLTDLLKHHIARGLHLTFPTPEEWHMQIGKKEDTGTMRQPLRVVLGCADRIMR